MKDTPLTDRVDDSRVVPEQLPVGQIGVGVVYIDGRRINLRDRPAGQMGVGIVHTPRENYSHAQQQDTYQ